MLLCIGSFLKNAAFLSELGYEAMDVDLSAVIFRGATRDPMLDGENWRENVLAARAECEKAGMKLSSCHLPFTYRYVDPKDERYDYCHEGTIPWEETMIALKEIGYDGDFNLELDFNRVPQPLLKPYLEYSLQVARYLMSVFDGAERSLDLENKV